MRGSPTCGLITGLFVHITAVSLGVAALFQSSETAFNMLKFAGAAYLLYLAWLSFRSGTSKGFTPEGAIPRIRHAVPERGDH